MAPWGLCLCEGLWCPSMSECLPASLVLVGGLSMFFQREEGLSLLLPGQGEVRYVHNDSSHIPPGTPSTQHTGILLLLCKEKSKFCWQQEAVIPSLAFPASCHACHGYGCAPTRARICDWSTLEQDLLHPTSDFFFLCSWRHCISNL